MEFNDYESLLARAESKLPKKHKSHERFEMPEVDTLVEGNQTLIRNFNDVAQAFGRKPSHILKYLLKELAAPGNLDGNRAVIQRVLRRNVIAQKLNEYAKEYVYCHECSRPDTTVSELEGEKIIKCEACGGWWPLRRLK